MHIAGNVPADQVSVYLVLSLLWEKIPEQMTNRMLCITARSPIYSDDTSMSES